MTDTNTAYNKWMDLCKDPELKAELISIKNDDKEIQERFYTSLEFGTAGLRGILGAGTNRMNLYVVRQATAGLADALKERRFSELKTRGVAIAFDSRKNSELFAKEAASVLAAKGIHVYLYEKLHSVPQLSFTIGYKNCIAGIVITASHNPKIYNGFKVYGENGGQLNPELSAVVTEKIKAVNMFEIDSMPLEEATKKGLITVLREETDSVYYDKAYSLLLHQNELSKEQLEQLSVVYTPLYGCGAIPVKTLLTRLGVKLHIVSEQFEPNSEFPSVAAPNPEDKNALTMGIKLAKDTNSDIVLATDPDSDRLGAAILVNGEYITLSGNQIACILIYYILSSKKDKGTLPKNGIVVKSIVSTTLANRICEDFSVSCIDVLTGFRFISEWIEKAEKSDAIDFIFGFEESFGFLAGSFSRDKDAISSSLLLCEAAAYYKAKDKSLYDVLDEIYDKYGLHMEKTKSYTESGIEGMKKIAEAMKKLRASEIKQLGSMKVIRIEDYKTGIAKDIASEKEEKLSLPQSDVLRILLDSGWVCVRPSGTEPKLKVYAAVSGNEKDLDNVMNGICEKIDI